MTREQAPIAWLVDVALATLSRNELAVWLTTWRINDANQAHCLERTVRELLAWMRDLD